VKYFVKKSTQLDCLI